MDLDIISFQASINWDPALLTFKGVSNFGIADFGIEGFGITAADQGHVNFLWEPNDAAAVSLTDGATLFTATFEVISDTQSTASIGFVDNVTNPAFEMEFANDNYDILDVNTTNGVITIFSSTSEILNIVSFPNTSCDIKVVNGRLEADVNGNTGDFTFHWFEGAEVTETPDFTGSIYDQIPAGDYALTVLDENDAVFVDKKLTAVLDIPAGTPDEISVLTSAPQISCSDDPADFTGKIEIAVNDGQPADTYNISWWKGDSETGEELTGPANSYTATDLAAGNYEVVVENPDTGCRSYFSSVVSEQLITFSLSVASTDNNFCADGSNGTASVQASDASNLNLRYFWFLEDAVIDTTQALAKGQTMEQVLAGSYKSFAMDTDSKCSAVATVSLEIHLSFPILQSLNATIRCSPTLTMPAGLRTVLRSMRLEHTTYRYQVLFTVSAKPTSSTVSHLQMPIILESRVWKKICLASVFIPTLLVSTRASPIHMTNWIIWGFLIHRVHCYLNYLM
jgi:hypothetical protein